MVCVNKFTEKNGSETSYFRNGNFFAVVSAGLIIVSLRGNAKEVFIPSVIAGNISLTASIGSEVPYLTSLAEMHLA
jgi:hypothetical protein